MIRKISLLFLCFAMVAFSSEAKEMVINGYSKLEGLVQKDLLVVNGTLAILDSTLDKVHINGSIKAKKIKLNELSVSGNADLKKITAIGNMTVEGGLEIEDSNIKDLIINSNKVKLEDTTANTIIFKDSKDASDDEPILYLSGKCNIKKIIFESKKGKVVKNEHSKVGKIEGGIIEQKD
jgi:hypothetical protein